MVELRADVIALTIFAALLCGCVLGIFIGHQIGFINGNSEGMKSGYYLGSSDQKQIDEGNILAINQSINGIPIGSINETKTTTTIIVPECDETNSSESGICMTAIDAISGKPLLGMKYTLTNTSKVSIITGDLQSYYNTTRDWGVVV